VQFLAYVAILCLPASWSNATFLRHKGLWPTFLLPSPGRPYSFGLFSASPCLVHETLYQENSDALP
jgi:hypothetical protein